MWTRKTSTKPCGAWVSFDCLLAGNSCSFYLLQFFKTQWHRLRHSTIVLQDIYCIYFCWDKYPVIAVIAGGPARVLLFTVLLLCFFFFLFCFVFVFFFHIILIYRVNYYIYTLEPVNALTMYSCFIKQERQCRGKQVPKSTVTKASEVLDTTTSQCWRSLLKQSMFKRNALIWRKYHPSPPTPKPPSFFFFFK